MTISPPLSQGISRWPYDRGFVYCVYDHTDQLLYVGSTGDLGNRLRSHARYSHWSAQAARVEWQEYESREEALRAETRLIVDMCPLHNLTYNSGREKLRQSGHDRTYPLTAWAVLGQRVRQRRDQLALSQRRLAEQARLDLADVRRLERGWADPEAPPSVVELDRLANALDLRLGCWRAVLIDGADLDPLTEDELHGRAIAAHRAMGRQR